MPRRREKHQKINDFDPCYLCGRHVGPRGEMDHFPRSHALGGKQALPACVSCHDLKDRVRLEDWPDTISMKAALGLFHKASAAEMNALTEMLECINKQERGQSDWNAERMMGRLDRIWTKANGTERLLLAKMMHVLDMAEAEIQKRRSHAAREEEMARDVKQSLSQEAKS